ncbi:hypothetical protein CAOG_08580 [Capsaspora owczarzaki ATCC 30864]|uniref:Septin-type G domain-containing protein n=1 Tax=Capsaspora owczarzaki (strain ATCC 30864) TaxID=595528 RepID=A0A0D2WLP3_CAPO3|nr:hypothetical protein CAOG_08580 [Capsaspora owczarzaki ATCC 30864]KJE90863.1 hypothetical protein CAOG_008580 [Capsaspora owczarzaki ATCC 30864]|eukprot:XP_011270180.1 hypothetical protein CAOG_08580 [Capsaspora owczarzaki ATCC 30864]
MADAATTMSNNQHDSNSLLSTAARQAAEATAATDAVQREELERKLAKLTEMNLHSPASGSRTSLNQLHREHDSDHEREHHHGSSDRLNNPQQQQQQQEGGEQQAANSHNDSSLVSSTTVAAANHTTATTTATEPSSSSSSSSAQGAAGAVAGGDAAHQSDSNGDAAANSNRSSSTGAAARDKSKRASRAKRESRIPSDGAGGASQADGALAGGSGGGDGGQSAANNADDDDEDYSGSDVDEAIELQNRVTSKRTSGSAASNSGSTSGSLRASHALDGSEVNLSAIAQAIAQNPRMALHESSVDDDDDVTTSNYTGAETQHGGGMHVTSFDDDMDVPPIAPGSKPLRRASSATMAAAAAMVAGATGMPKTTNIDDTFDDEVDDDDAGDDEDADGEMDDAAPFVMLGKELRASALALNADPDSLESLGAEGSQSGESNDTSGAAGAAGAASTETDDEAELALVAAIRERQAKHLGTYPSIPFSAEDAQAIKQKQAAELQASAEQAAILSASPTHGIAGLSQGLLQKMSKIGHSLNLIVVGESGLGKSTFVRSFFRTAASAQAQDPIVQSSLASRRTVEISTTTHVLEENNVKLNLTITDTPGYGDLVNNDEESWRPITQFIDHQHNEFMNSEFARLFGDGRRVLPRDSRIHACLFFIAPTGHGLKSTDLIVLRKLQMRVNIIPVIARADSMAPAERAQFREKLRTEFVKYGIHVYKFPGGEHSAYDADERVLQEHAIPSPLSVLSSDKEITVGDKKVLGRQYSWGAVTVVNEAQSDFMLLQRLLLGVHAERLRDITHEIHYEAYRRTHRNQLASIFELRIKNRLREKLIFKDSDSARHEAEVPPVPHGTIGRNFFETGTLGVAGTHSGRESRSVPHVSSIFAAMSPPSGAQTASSSEASSGPASNSTTPTSARHSAVPAQAQLVSAPSPSTASATVSSAAILSPTAALASHQGAMAPVMSVSSPMYNGLLAPAANLANSLATLSASTGNLVEPHKIERSPSVSSDEGQLVNPMSSSPRRMSDANIDQVELAKVQLAEKYSTMGKMGSGQRYNPLAERRRLMMEQQQQQAGGAAAGSAPGSGASTPTSANSLSRSGSTASTISDRRQSVYSNADEDALKKEQKKAKDKEKEKDKKKSK